MIISHNHIKHHLVNLAAYNVLSNNVAKSSLLSQRQVWLNNGPQEKTLLVNKFRFSEQNKFVQGIYENQFEDEIEELQRAQKEKQKRAQNTDYYHKLSQVKFAQLLGTSGESNLLA